MKKREEVADGFKGKELTNLLVKKNQTWEYGVLSALKQRAHTRFLPRV